MFAFNLAGSIKIPIKKASIRAAQTLTEEVFRNLGAHFVTTICACYLRQLVFLGLGPFSSTGWLN